MRVLPKDTKFLSLLWQRPTARRLSIITWLIRPTSRQTIRTTQMKKKKSDGDAADAAAISTKADEFKVPVNQRSRLIALQPDQ
jgi:hypothetical protein